MALIDRVRERTGSDLSDAELNAMIAAAAAEVAARLGPAGPITVELGSLADPRTRPSATLRLARPMDGGAGATIVEHHPGDSGGAGTVLDAADWRALHGGRTLQRLTGGPNGASHWAPLVTITYTPVDDAAARDEAIIALVHVDLTARGGLTGERAGDYSYTLGDPAAARERIFESLAQWRGMVMA